jgi:hypothetical protein
VGWNEMIRHGSQSEPRWPRQRQTRPPFPFPVPVGG